VAYCRSGTVDDYRRLSILGHVEHGRRPACRDSDDADWQYTHSHARVAKHSADDTCLGW
jgi:hypothetical protein